MEIFVCVKQVPSTNQVQVDEKTGILKRNEVAGKMNPYDLYALETALRLREANGGRVVAGTMGPLQSERVIREALEMGADEGYLFSDRQMGGADVLATSYTLSQAILSIKDFDLIICGKQTTDGDTAQVGPAIAEHLHIPHAAWVSALKVQENGLCVEQQLQEQVETIWMPFPCLVSVEQGIYTPRLPSLLRRRKVKKLTIPILGLDAFLDTDPAHYGMEGSPTQVERVFPPEYDRVRETWTGAEGITKLHQWLKKHKYM